MASVFSRIINGELPCYKVAEDEKNIAILDIEPIVKGHVLVIPKNEGDKIYELPEEDYLSLMAFAAHVARGVEKAMDCIRVGYEVVGLDVHHVHVHLLPLSGPKDMDLSRPHLDLTGEQMKEIAENIASHIEK